MITYFLVIVALLQMEDTAPLMVSPHATYDECAAAAQQANKFDARLEMPRAKELGLRYVCLHLRGEA